MAKYSRYDPRNKNRGRNKSRSLDKDIRIREVDDSRFKNQAFLREVVYDEYEEEDDFLIEENSKVS
jgi:hypothetical protein